MQMGPKQMPIAKNKCKWTGSQFPYNSNNCSLLQWVTPSNTKQLFYRKKKPQWREGGFQSYTQERLTLLEMSSLDPLLH